MSATKEWLADPVSISAETRRTMDHPDPFISDIGRRYLIRRRLECADGFSMSVQYSNGHYCNGRSMFLGGEMDDESQPLPEPKTVEVGFPSQGERLLKPYAEQASRPMFVGRWDFSQSLYWKLKYGPKWLRWLAALWPKWSNLTGTVYGWVPVEVVDAVIAKHGGIKGPAPEYDN